MKRLVFAALLVGAAPVLAQTQPAAQTPTGADDQNRVICERVKETGSRIGGKKVCMTKLQWEEQRRRDREAIDEVQRRRTEPSGG